MKTLTPENEQDSDKLINGDAYKKELEVDTIARTIWGEARGEGTTGMQAVACVILNRLNIASRHKKYWWGNSIIEICQKPYQFSAWNKSDPNFRKLLAVDTDDIHFATAKRIARRAVYHKIDDPTSGATHYHAASITPAWAKNEKPVAVIGSHVFYKLV